MKIFLYDKTGVLFETDDLSDAMVDRVKTQAHNWNKQNPSGLLRGVVTCNSFPPTDQIASEGSAIKDYLVQDADTGILRRMTDKEKVTAGKLPALTASQKYDSDDMITDKTREEMIADATITLVALKEEKHVAVNDLRASKIETKGVTYNGKAFDTDARSREIISGLLAMVGAGISLPDGFTYRTRDNTDMAFTSNDVKALAGLVVAMVNAHYNASWTIKAAIDALTTSDAVVAYNINNGWP